MHAVRAVDLVAIGQRRHDSGSSTFLPDAGMDRPVHKTFSVKLKELLLEVTNQKYLLQHAREAHAVLSAPVVIRGFKTEPLSVSFQI